MNAQKSCRAGRTWRQIQAHAQTARATRIAQADADKLDDRHTALQQAASLMSGRLKSLSTAIIEGSDGCLIACWVFPGAIEVRGPHFELIARSKPGHPLELDPGLAYLTPMDAGKRERLQCLHDRGRRLRVLAFGASVLQARDAREWRPKVSFRCHLRRSTPSMHAVAVLHWPGVLRVTDRDTGELLAQSLPGRPFDLDPTV